MLQKRLAAEQALRCHSELRTRKGDTAVEGELLKELSRLCVERMKDEYHRAEAELEKRLPPPCGGCPVRWQDLGRGRHALVVPTHTHSNG